MATTRFTMMLNDNDDDDDTDHPPMCYYNRLSNHDIATIPTKRKVYPPSPYILFFRDQTRKLNGVIDDHNDAVPMIAHRSSSTTITSLQPLSSSTAMNVEMNERNKRDLSTTINPSMSPRRTTGTREPTQFAIQVFKVTRLWKQLSYPEKKVWEQRAARIADEINATETTNMDEDSEEVL